jgi:hypothetical protein
VTAIPLELVRRTVEGDLRAFASLLTLDPLTLDESREALPGLLLAPEAVKRVLLALQQNEVEESLVQAWASFVRRGYFGFVNQPRKPLDIAFDERHEDQIATVVARLDELGDSIDGSISPEELKELMDSLHE